MITPEEVAALAVVYDRFANALERTSSDRLQARHEFYARLQRLYDAEGSRVAYDAFRFEAVKLCKEYLRKN